MVLKRYLPLLFIPLNLHAIDCKDHLSKMFLKLYPNQNDEIMHTRLQNVTDKHQFLRSFAPYYYQEIYHSADELPVFLKMKKTTGQMVGDAHAENFGFVVGNDGKSILTLNDFDDVAKGPIILDVLRLSQSALYFDKRLDHGKLLRAYTEGLKNSPYKMSEYIQNLAEKSAKGGKIPKANFAQTPLGNKFTIKREPNFPTTSEQQKTLELLLKKKFGAKVKLLDSYRTTKENGGSAFGKRYHLLAEIDGKTQFIELKEIQNSGVLPELMTSTVQSNSARVLEARDTFLGNGYNQMLDVVSFEKEAYQLRFKSEGNKSIDIATADYKDVPKIIKDEFYVLGQLHRKSLGDKVEPYLKDLDNVTTNDWDKTIEFMQKKISHAFDEANKEK
jgi:hypothetical protein